MSTHLHSDYMAFRIAELGADAFYTGKIATNIAEAAHARGGIITTHDLANYSAIIREPVNISELSFCLFPCTLRSAPAAYRNSRIFSTVAPSSGAVVLSALKIFEGYQGNYTDSDPEINVTTHRLIEATQFAYGQRTQCMSPLSLRFPFIFLLQVDSVPRRRPCIHAQCHGSAKFLPDGCRCCGCA